MRFPGVSEFCWLLLEKPREAYVSSHDMLTFKKPLFDLHYKFIIFVKTIELHMVTYVAYHKLEIFSTFIYLEAF